MNQVGTNSQVMTKNRRSQKKFSDISTTETERDTSTEDKRRVRFLKKKMRYGQEDSQASPRYEKEVYGERSDEFPPLHVQRGKRPKLINKKLSQAYGENIVSDEEERKEDAKQRKSSSASHVISQDDSGNENGKTNSEFKIRANRISSRKLRPKALS